MGGSASGADLLERVKNQEIAQVLRLRVGHSKVLRTAFPITRISVADPEIADIILISEKEIYVNGLAPGVTNLSLWGKSRFTTATVTVEADVSLLKEKLHQILPKEKVGVEAAGDTVVLSGEVSGPLAQETAISLAVPYAGGKKEKVVNLMHVGGVQQVLVEVRLAEIAEWEGQAAGLLLSFPGSQILRLDAAVGRYFLRLYGLSGTLRILGRALRFAGSTEARGGEYYVSNLAVLPAFWGKGIARGLLQHAEEKARAQAMVHNFYQAMEWDEETGKPNRAAEWTASSALGSSPGPNSLPETRLDPRGRVPRGGDRLRAAAPRLSRRVPRSRTCSPGSETTSGSSPRCRPYSRTTTRTSASRSSPWTEKLH